MLPAIRADKSPVRVIILTAAIDGSFMLGRGAQGAGIVLKNSDPAYLLAASIACDMGAAGFEPEVAERAKASCRRSGRVRREALAPRERQLVTFVRAACATARSPSGWASPKARQSLSPRGVRENKRHHRTELAVRADEFLREDRLSG